MRILVLFLVVTLLDAAAGWSSGKDDAAREVLDRYLGSARESRGIDGEARQFVIDASLPRMHKQGGVRGLKLISGAGRVVFTELHFVGDDVIKRAVLARFLSAEANADPAGEDLGVTRRNYRFHYKGNADYNGRTAFVFRTVPTRRLAGLFRGELWLDAETARPLREWGQFVKSPSVFLSDIYFVRDYVPDGPESSPRRTILKLRVAFAGPVELTMWLDEPPAAF
ncbi:conserved hypothetical protein [Candidatus Sulfopaludibacter sp. SbA3]|nr:conserved hypothetical protein [Candidatus Sulfopaludibacter sp. SbA3]